jgi:hypothetical protein
MNLDYGFMEKKLCRVIPKLLASNTKVSIDTFV